MEDKKFLKVTGKRVEKNGNVVEAATAIVPYVKCGSASLPDIPPFNTNIWLDGDTGYHMRHIRFTLNGIEYFYNHHYDFVEGKVHVQPGEKIDESCSKFFGMPCLPESMQPDPYPDDGVFFAQIRCEDIRDLDPEGRLPHEGYLYFFLDAEMYPSDQLHMMVDHRLEEPEYVIDDYNENCNIKGLTDTYVITFEKVDAGYEGTKLLGYPSNDVDDSGDRTGLLLQYDPLDFDVPFLSTLDGYAFVFFGEDETNKFCGLDYVVWGS